MKPVASASRLRLPALALFVAAVAGPPPWAQDNPDATLQTAKQRIAPLDEVRAALEIQRADAEGAHATRMNAERGDADAQLRLGRHHFAGKGVPQDDSEGVRWVRRAAEQGHAEAQNVLATAYSLGRGVPADQREAARWRRLAAEQGYVLAQTLLGNAYSEGKGVLKDIAEAMRWYRLAAEEGNDYAQFSLAMTYLHEEVVTDRVLAHMWFNVASANGGWSMPAIWELIEAPMTREEILRATKLARACMDSDYQSCGP